MNGYSSERRTAVRKVIVAGAVLTALALNGCGGEPATTTTSAPVQSTASAIASVAPMKNPPSAMKWVTLGYQGNIWLGHVKSTTWKGEQLVVKTDYAETDAKTREAAGLACTAFRAYELFVIKGATVKVVGADGSEIAAC
jgi:hypothetical protein